MRKWTPSWAAAALFLVVIVTTHRYSSGDPESSNASDVFNYFSIARAAPDLPLERIAYNHAQRIAVPYTLGLLSHVVPLSLDTIFQIAALLVIAAAVAIFAMTLIRAQIHPSIICAVTALYVFNPYLIRLPL